MPKQDIYESIRLKIVSHLGNSLAPNLFYHGVHHTLDVLSQAERIALSEKITGEEELFLLRIACLYHDSGFMFTYQEHEVAGCKLAKEDLPAFGITPRQLDIICGLIMATKIPQTPLTKLEEVICDADLDYLGRDDFERISNTLFLELKERNIVSTENAWNLIQANFFKHHHFYTATTRELREKKKQIHLEMIEAMIQNEPTNQ